MNFDADISGTDNMENFETRLINISRGKLCRYYFLAVFIFYLWYQATMNVLDRGVLFAYKNVTDFVLGITINFLMVFLLSIINSYIIFGIKWKRNKTWRTLIDLSLSQIAPVITNLLFLALTALSSKRGTVMWLQSFVLNFMIFLMNEVVWYVIKFKHSQYLYQTTLRVATQLEYNVLRAQVNPHFLFNSLNILYSLTHIDITKSREFILSLSKMYRYIMTRRDSLTISLSEEFEFLRAYVDVLKMLYYDSFEVKIKNENAIGQQQILPYSLQLLIENVTKHNVIRKEMPMEVTISVEADKMVVSNPIRLKEESSNEKSSGVGLLYLTKLYSLYGKEFKYSADDENNFVVEIPYIDQIKNISKTN